MGEDVAERGRLGRLNSEHGVFHQSTELLILVNKLGIVIQRLVFKKY